MVKKILKEEKGQGLLLFIFIFFIISLYFTLFSLNLYHTHRRIKDRLKTYLCYKYLHSKTEKYIEEISSANKLLKAIYPATKYPSGKARQLEIIALQTSSHISYMKDLTKNRYCHFTQGLSFIKNVPYKHTGFLLMRGPMETTILRKRKWKNLVPSYQKPSFLIRGNYQLDTPYSKWKLLNSKEIMPDFLP